MGRPDRNQGRRVQNGGVVGSVTRRRLFELATAAALARSATPASSEHGKRDMIVRSARPLDLEMPLSGFQHPITPIDQFFVRCHHYTPAAVKIADWRLELAGLVNTPVTLTLDELKQLPRLELAAVLECAGNGRAFYEPHVPGMQWEYGGVGCARWAGVRLGDVLKKAGGVKEGALDVLFDGADTPMGSMPKFQRTITVQKALDPDTLLVYEMNGEPLPHIHGGPVRLMPSGWAGDSWVKWVQRIEVLDKPFEGFWMKSAYRHPGHGVPPGTAVDPAQMQPVTNLKVKSAIATPAPNSGISMRPVKITGVAWSNGSPVTEVDVSVDGGSTWHPARMGKDHGRYAFRLFETTWTPKSEGEHVLMSRARNAAGQTQGMEQEWNPSGYLWNVVQRVPVSIGEKSETVDGMRRAPAGSHPPGYDAACLSCHKEDVIIQQHLTRGQWEKEIDKMVRWGAPVEEKHRGALLDYLARFGQKK